ncbi:MAG: PAS domain-containing sensor histidine kinase [Pseudomonadota bacterium]
MDDVTVNVEDHYLKRELYERVQTDPEIFEFLQAGSLDGIWYWDLENLEHEWLSDRFKSFFGFQPDEMEHSTDWWQANIDPDDLKLALENFEAHAADPNHPYDQIVRYKHRDGSTVWVRCRGLAIRDEDGKPIRMLGAHTDVTALKRAEKEVGEINALLEERNAMLRDFASVAAHDLSAPLRHISMFSEVLREDIEAGNTAEAVEALDRIDRRIDHMRRLIKAVLDFSVTGMTVTPAVSVALAECVDRSIEAADTEEIIIHTDIDPDLKIEGDADLVVRVIDNMLSNAIKYANQDAPEIWIAAEPAERNHVQVTVTDNGKGVPPDFVETIFNPFTRGEVAPSGADGFGIGLALVRRIMESHRGSVALDLDYRDGARFVLVFLRASV